jgi:hypothetical protein
MMLYYRRKLGLISVRSLLLYVAIVRFLVWKMIANKRETMEASGKVAGQMLLTMDWLEAGDKEKTQFISQANFLSFNAAVIGRIPVFSYDGLDSHDGTSEPDSGNCGGSQ